MRYFIISFLISTVAFGCAVKKNNGLPSSIVSNELVIAEAFIQPEVPGTRDAASKNYVTIEIKPSLNNEIVLDSILYVSSTFNTVRMRASNRMKFHVTEKECSLETEEGLRDRATVYFRKNNKHYHQVINDFLVKELLWLP